MVAIIAGAWLGIPLQKFLAALQKGIGDTVGGLLVILALGAMLGKLVAESGAANRIAQALMAGLGPKYVQWALLTAGFIIGIPLFYGVGFVLMVPLIFSVIYRYKLPAVYRIAGIGRPVCHAWLPSCRIPHRWRSWASSMRTWALRSMGYGLIVGSAGHYHRGAGIFCLPERYTSRAFAAIQAGQGKRRRPKQPVLAKRVSFPTALLPVLLLIVTTLLQLVTPGSALVAVCG